MKKFRLKELFVSIAIVLLCILTLPLAFSKSNVLKVATGSNTITPAAGIATSHSLLLIYDSLNLDELGLSAEAFNYAITGYEKLKQSGKIFNDKVISIVDFTKPSYKKRLFVIDLNNYKLLFNTYVAHGQNTGAAYAKAFSNKAESHQSSLGFYITSGTYNGGNGYSMYLNGVENGFNNQAYDRSIVMHGAPYVSEGMIRSKGYIGRSHGCPAVPEKLNKPIIEKIKNGSCFFIYSDNRSYLSKSRLLHT
ncbi:MAG: murein L,D-transpeptidase catalytic domain family protein [Rhizobacter sp.]|nr:murein L,D-transpeptidase catalytic domain family protein [Ferruginibacter sp.]